MFFFVAEFNFVICCGEKNNFIICFTQIGQFVSFYIKLWIKRKSINNNNKFNTTKTNKRTVNNFASMKSSDLLERESKVKNTHRRLNNEIVLQGLLNNKI